METTSTPSTIETEKFWQHHEELLKNSELSRAAYCRQHGLNYFRFSNRVKKSRQNVSPNKLVAVNLKLATDNNTIQKLLCTLEVGGGRCLRIYDTQALSFILERIS